MTTCTKPRRRIWMAALASLGVLALGACDPRFAAYDLPPEPKRYTLTLDNGNTHTTWRFWSSQVSEDETPEGFVCPEQIHAVTVDNLTPPPCRAEPLIFLQYDAGVDLTNAVRAPGAHHFTVTAYRQAEDGPRILGLKLWTSVDGGKTWRPATVKAHGRGHDGTQEYRVKAVYPPVRKTAGSVSIRAEAWDADGNRVQQRIDRAFDLRR